MIDQQTNRRNALRGIATLTYMEPLAEPFVTRFVAALLAFGGAFVAILGLLGLINDPAACVIMVLTGAWGIAKCASLNQQATAGRDIHAMRITLVRLLEIAEQEHQSVPEALPVPPPPPATRKSRPA